jgi:magnesium transporter
MIVECAYYARGVRQAQERMSFEDAAALPRRGGNYLWIELVEPSATLMSDACQHFCLHELAVEDAAHAHQRPKVEAYDGFHLIVIRTARYDDLNRQVEFGEIDMFLGTGFVIAVRHGAAGKPLRAQLHLGEHEELSKRGPAAVVWAILDVVVDEYGPVVEGLEGEIEEIETAVFAGREDLTERIYLLKRQINEVYRAVHPLLIPLDALAHGQFTQMDPALVSYFRDISDHVRRVQDEVVAQRDQLVSVLEANLSLISVRQNEIAAQQNRTMKLLTVVAGVFLPLTFVTGFFGQNFGWMVRHIDSFTVFAAAGVGGLLLPSIFLLAWLRRGGHIGG